MNDSKPLANQVACVTGGGSGIGRSAALQLAFDGARVAVLGRTRSELEETAQMINAQGGESLVLTADITQAEEMAAAYKKLDDTFGRLDILFANAGINGVWAPIDELEIEEWKQTIDVNLTGTFITLKLGLPLLKQQGGSIIITASINGTRVFSNGGASAYSTTKAGQVALAKMLALELAQHRVRVNVICPGAIESSIEDNTDRQALERARVPVEYPAGTIPLTGGEPGTAQDVADLVAFLASERARHITGTELWIDGAQSLLMG